MKTGTPDHKRTQGEAEASVVKNYESQSFEVQRRCYSCTFFSCLKIKAVSNKTPALFTSFLPPCSIHHYGIKIMVACRQQSSKTLKEAV